MGQDLGVFSGGFGVILRGYGRKRVFKSTILVIRGTAYPSCLRWGFLNLLNTFVDTPLKSILDEQGIEQLTLVGNISHMCVDAIARAAADYGYANTVIANAYASHELEFGGVKVPAAQVHAAFMAAQAFAYAEVLCTDEYLARTF
jgi:nicotinamidase-related amidase